MKLINAPHITLSAIMLSVSLGAPAPCYAVPTVLGASQDGLLAMDKLGNIWGTNKTEGKNAQQIVKFSGKRTQFTRKAYSASLIKNLKPKDSIYSHSVDGQIDQVWPLSDGTVLFMASVRNKNYLYKLNPATNTVGNNNLKKYNNTRAVMNVGERFYGSVLKKRVHSEDVRALHQRSLIEATIAGKKVLFFGDYNVNTKAKPGGVNDQVALWKSTDMGNTWSRVVEWNTNGVHTLDHIHGIKQNPYNGWIYLLMGDGGKENAIVAWDGISKAIPNNTPLTEIGLKNKYPGWRAIAGTDTVRTGDIVFTKTKCVWLPDTDYIKPGTVLHAQRANHDLSGLQAAGSFAYSNTSSPILATLDAKGVIYWASFRTDIDASLTPPKQSPKRVQLWASYDSGLTWQKPLDIKTYNDWTTVPQNLFVAPWGELVLSGRGVNFTPQAGASGSSAFLKP